MSHEKCNCHKLTLVVLGSQPNQRDGLLFICMNNSDTLHGTPDNPGGLIKAHSDLKKEVEELKAWKWKIAGGCAAITALITVGPHIIRLLAK